MINKENLKKWYIDFIVGLISIMVTWIIYFNYQYIFDEDLPSGKGAKLFLLIVKVLDKIGGKPLVIFLLVTFTMFVFYNSFKKLKNEKK